MTYHWIHAVFTARPAIPRSYCRSKHSNRFRNFNFPQIGIVLKESICSPFDVLLVARVSLQKRTPGKFRMSAVKRRLGIGQTVSY